MTKRLIMAAMLCFCLAMSFKLNSYAMQKEGLLNMPGISGKEAGLSVKKHNLQEQNLEALKAEVLKRKKIGPVLNNFLAGKGNSYVRKTGQKKDMIRLILNIAENKTPIYDAVSKYKGKILHKQDGMMAVELPAENVEKLINETDAITYARLPLRFFPMAVSGEAVPLFGATNFQTAGYKGAGVRIAVIDVGFKGLTEAYRTGDIPYGTRTYDFTGSGLETEYYHGTACAELIYELAPAAELYLLKVYDEYDIYRAIDFCIEKKINIINFSLGASGTGPGDGTGRMDEYFNKAVDNGILVVAAAGNYADFESGEYSFGGHWEGVFYDSDNDGIHEFVMGGQKSTYNVIGAYAATNDDDEPVTGEVSIMMRWNDDWDSASVDYDMYLYEYDYSKDEVGELLDFSVTTQDGFQSPFEQIVIDLTDFGQTHYYALEVRKKAGEAVLTNLEIYLAGTSTFWPFDGYSSAIATSGSSMTEPADAESVLAVGAIYYGSWDTGPQEDFSSQGPTNAWAGSITRVKPDICGPDGVSTYTFGEESFFGTSASTPVVAGAAALILSLNPAFDPDELKSILEANSIEMGAEGKDNLYGSGRIELLSLDVSAAPDADDDGMPDSWEALYGLDTFSDDSVYDPDNDGYTNLMEYRSGTIPLDADTDDDGISDGDEDANKNSSLDDGETFPTRTDSDDDWLQDGTEMGVTSGVVGTDTGIFIPDDDPSTTTDPMDADTDGDGIKDGKEDANHNGRVDSGETDPNVPNATGDDGGNGDGDGGGCFIATAAYGSYMEPHVMVLRQFRDRVLLKSRLGKASVKFYYRYSPPVADFIAEYDVLKVMIQWVFSPIILMSQLTLLLGTKALLFFPVFFFTLVCITAPMLLKRKRLRHY